MFVLILLSCLITIIHSLDVSWLPSDPDGPLPLSSNYRAALGKLCTMISSGQTLPPEIKEKLPILQKLCIKLQSSSAYSFDSLIPWKKFSKLASPNMLVTLALAGAGTVVWFNRRPIAKYIQKNFVSISRSPSSSGTSSRTRSYANTASTATSTSTSTSLHSSNGKIDMDAVRQARIRQYALDTNKNNSIKETETDKLNEQTADNIDSNNSNNNIDKSNSTTAE